MLSPRTIILAGAVAASLAIYFLLSFYVFPQSYQLKPRRPEAIANTTLSSSEIKLGDTFIISVTGTNKGEEADMELVSIGFPNFTRTDEVKIVKQNFAQTPILINVGDHVGSEYSGNGRTVNAQYASIEAFSRPWPAGYSYGIDLQVKPGKEGPFAVLVKSIAFPHSWDGAHWPNGGTSDYQKEFVEVHYVRVIKP